MMYEDMLPMPAFVLPHERPLQTGREQRSVIEKVRALTTPFMAIRVMMMFTLFHMLQDSGCLTLPSYRNTGYYSQSINDMMFSLEGYGSHSIGYGSQNLRYSLDAMLRRCQFMQSWYQLNNTLSPGSF